MKSTFSAGAAVIAGLTALFLADTAGRAIGAPASAFAETIERPKLIVRSVVTVKGPFITLGDIADLSAPDPAYDRLLNDLRGIKLSDAPPPRTKTSIPGSRILAAIQEKGVLLDTIAYAVPQVVSVETAGRVLAPNEVLAVARETLARDSALDVQLRDLAWDTAQVIPTGAATIEIERLGMPNAGRIPLRVLVAVDGIPSARFMATAIVDDWREVPVLRKTLERGMLVSPEDIELVRLNLYQQPQDVAESAGEVIGRRLKSRIDAGATLRRTQIDLPPLISKGKRIVAVYQAGGLRATAGSVALEDGQKGEIVRVRNESSKKTLKARILSADEVEVITQ